MNDRQFFALKMPARDNVDSTGSDYQDIIRSPSGAIVLTVLNVELFAKRHPSWHAVAMVLDPRTKRIAPLTAIPLKLHSELRTIVARMLIGVGRDPSEIHPRDLGWHCYRLCTVEEVGQIPEPPSEIAAPPPEPLIVRPEGPQMDLAEHGFTAAELLPADVVLGKEPASESDP